MFDIDSLMPDEIKYKFSQAQGTEKQVEFLIRLLDYEMYFVNYIDKIAEYCKEKSNEVYDMQPLRQVINEKKFITEYALKVENMSKVKELINSLCNDVLNGSNEFENIIQKADSEFDVLQDIGDMDLTFEEKENHSGNSLSRVLAHKGV